ncbi:phosphodiester glycosidase family protein [Paenibacillus sp. N3.4]|uniref:phosphodiester glycosidase family protein n=1 Tax=Paenibacillus sp. N3.4 TaxID=2603222 RepID=UPI0011CA4A07|nr:phosphodiester glycosidase family protein [Paenibacillus sp. N3.4]TXK75885.1 phosphodiester glycosidase family protein [Paenibacillus sp. N3.4]
MSTARYKTFTTGGITCHAIIADYDACTVEGLGSSSTLRSTGKFGINGTFYGTNPNRVWQIAAGYGGSPAVTGGDVNCYPRQTMICYSYQGSSTRYISISHLSKISEFGSGLTIHWAIGGVGYYLDKVFSGEQDFINKVSVLETTKGLYNDPVYNFDKPGFKCYHTAIGYRTSDSKIIMMACDDSSAWQVRSIMQDYIGCNDAIYLDSNPSTQLRGRTAGGSIQEFAAVTSSVLSYVTVNPTSWVDI